MLSTMQDAPLLVREILRHGEQVHGRKHRRHLRGRQLPPCELHRGGEGASAGWRPGWRASEWVGTTALGTFCFNHQEHLEVYLAVPAWVR